ncbi:MAG TPA: hypothetical protein VFD43_09290 [Planctomycetota bacterium]|nr:hypothetical protein [Planctomycetota bacterium]
MNTAIAATSAAVRPGLRKLGASVVLAAFAALVATAPPGAAQQTVPNIGEPGDIVAIEGTGLAGTAQVDFVAIVGGFVGFLHAVVPPVSVSDTRVEVEVPLFGAFLPPPPLADGDPIGFVTLWDHQGQPIGESRAIWYLEITFGAVQTVGQGSPQPGGTELVLGFDHAGGAPAAGNPAFQLELPGGPPGTPAFVFAGLPATPPFPLINGGALVVDFERPHLVLGPYPIGLDGLAQARLPVPASVSGLTIVLQWALRHPANGAVLVSRTLQAML